MIRLVKYALILAAIAMLYKTFYYDYQKKESSAEVNTSVEAAEAVEPEPSKAVEPVKTTNADEQNKTGWQSRKGMPIDKLGDSIGDSLKDKIKVK